MTQRPKITISNAYPYDSDANNPVTGVFELGSNVGIEFETRTQQFFASSGTAATIVDTALELFDSDATDSIRQTLAFDIGNGVSTVTIDFEGFEKSSDRWGDTGNGGTQGDATGEDVHKQMAVLKRYLDTTQIDSNNPVQLEVGEFSSSGRYSAIDVIPENPNIRFDTAEATTVFQGSITWVSVISLNQALDTANQEDV